MSELASAYAARGLLKAGVEVVRRNSSTLLSLCSTPNSWCRWRSEERRKVRRERARTPVKDPTSTGVQTLREGSILLLFLDS